MDVQNIIADAKARFNHNSAKNYLKEKYRNKLIVSSQQGLWNADLQTINFLSSQTSEECILLDAFNNPVKVNRTELLLKLQTVYEKVMNDWHSEWSELEKAR